MALTKTQVSQLYVSLFGRASEGAGNTYWQTQNAASADTNTNRTNTATEMLGLTVVKTYFGVTDYTTAANVQTVVESIYLNVLGKTYAQDTVGVDYWVAQVAGGLSMGRVVNDLIIAINHADNRVEVADLAASNTFNNKVIVSDYVADNISVFTDTATFRAYVSSVDNTNATVVAAKADALADVPAAANPGSNFTLTTSNDVLTGTSGDDTFNAGEGAGGVATLTAGDTINGGAGVDTIRFVETGAITALPVGLLVSNVEIFNAIGGAAITLDTSALSSLTTVNTTNTAALQAITAGAAADVNTTRTVAGNTNVTVNGGKDILVTDAGSTAAISIGETTAASGTVISNQSHIYADVAADTTGTVIISGGTTITSAQTINFAASNAAAQLIDNTNGTATFGATTVTGGTTTTSVTATQTSAQSEVDSTTIGRAGIVNGAVTITDANNASATLASSIATVTVTSGAVVTVESSALTTLNLSGTISSVDADDLGALTTAAVTTLALNVNGLTTTGAVVIDTDITALTLDSSTTASTIVDLDIDGVVTLTVTGDALVTLSDQRDAAITAINSTNTGGISLGTELALATVFTGGSGNDAISIGATTGAQTMGAGNDTVTISSGTVGTGGSVDGGSGAADKLIMTDALAAAADGSAVFNGSFTNFEVLQISDSFTEDALDLDGLNDVDTVILALGAATATISNLNSGGTVQFNTTNNSGTTTINVDGAVAGSADVLNLIGFNTGDVYVYATVSADNVETINISQFDADITASGSVAAINTITLTAAAATSVVVSGNNGLNVTATGSVLVTNFNASGIVANNTTDAVNSAGTTDTLANLAVTYTSINNTANAVVTITGGAGDDILGGSAGAVNLDTIDGGGGADTLNGGTGADSLTGGEGADTLEGGAGVDSIILTETTSAADVVTVNAVRAVSSDSDRVIAVSNDNDTGEDTLTGFRFGSDTIDVVATGITTYIHATDTAIGTATGGVNDGTVGSFLATTGLIDVGSDSTLTIGTGDIALSFATPSVTMTEALFEAALSYDLTGTTAANTIVGGDLADSISGGGAAAVIDTLTGGLGADSITFTASTAVHVYNVAAGDTVLTIGGSGDAGTIAGFDVLNVDAAFVGDGTNQSSNLNVAGTGALMSAAAINDGTASTLNGKGSATVKSATVAADGEITFDDATTFGSAVSVDDDNDLAAVVQFMQSNDLGGIGSSAWFTAQSKQYIFTQGTADGSDNSKDTLVKIVGDVVSAISAANANSTGDLFIS